ncbi:MAG TPA: nickel pincer cofactor biosynthesis protein LarC [Gemmatimonadales bacterium]
MPIAILDPAAGISGDMTLGALLDAGVPAEWLAGLPARLGLVDVSVRIASVMRSSIVATKVDFAIPNGGEHHHGRSVGALIASLRGAAISDWVRERAVRAFELVGEAEGRVHGCEPSDVHLHEVGAVDALLDIVGAIEGFEQLGVSAVYNLPVAVGTGWVDAVHGRLPVPAPATAILLEGLDLVHAGPVEGEATTPTGAVLLRVLSDGPPPARWRIRGTGWGAGQRDPAGYPNALRLLVAEASGEFGELEVIATDIDDLTPEYVEPLRQALLDAGAVDCLSWPTHGKKGRAGIRIEALTPLDRTEVVIEAMFRHSTTAGIRRSRTQRRTLARREFVVELASGVRVRTKVRIGPDGPRVKAEFDDCLRAASALDRPAFEVAREAERRAEAMLDMTNQDTTASTKE